MNSIDLINVVKLFIHTAIKKNERPNYKNYRQVSLNKWLEEDL